MYGAALAPLLRNYSHWSWLDLDMLLGDLPAFLRRDELLHYDLITFAYDLSGSPTQAFLRGQLTLHANRPEINGFWARCAYLGDPFVDKLRAGARSTRGVLHPTIADEGCYSKAVFTHPSVRVLVSSRQLIDGRDLEQVALVEQQIRYCVRGPRLSACMQQLGQPLRAAERQRRDEGARALRGSYKPKGALERVPAEAYHQNCAWWIKPEYRTCVHLEPRASELGYDLVYKNGSFYRRGRAHTRPRLDAEHAYGTAAFFHFMRGKAQYARTLPVSPARPHDPYAYSPTLTLPTRENTEGPSSACARVVCDLQLVQMRCLPRDRAEQDGQGTNGVAVNTISGASPEHDGHGDMIRFT
jgi:hypothetical protein